MGSLGMTSNSNPPRLWKGLAAMVWRMVLLVCLAPAVVSAQTQPTRATTVPLLLPAGLAYDGAGNLYFSETGRHAVRRMSPTGILTTFAGTGVQGFDGDGGPAASALLNSPGAVAVDAAGNLFVADVQNRRIRRVDAATGIITTAAGTGVAGASADGTAASEARLDRPAALAVDSSGNLFFADAGTHLIRRVDHASGLVATVAGNGVQGYAGDGGPAVVASVDSPWGLAVDGGGNLYVADMHNQRIRRIDAATGVITSVAGTGQPGFSGDGGAAGVAALRMPRGVSLDAAGNVFLADSSNHRVRRVDAATGLITTIVGDGTQAYAGDSNPAVAASLDTPRAVTLMPGAGLATLADTNNGRVRQVDGAATIHTIAGLGGGGGGTAAGVLTLSAPTVVLYGSGVVNATLAASAATGSVTFFDAVGSAIQTLGSSPLSGNAASLPAASLAAGVHRISATYGGDALHSAAQSGTLSLTVSPAPINAAPASVNILYGEAVPALTGTLSGVLPQDAGAVTLALTTGARALSPVTAYPIAASLVGVAAGNYVLSATPATVTISKAPTVSTLSGVAMTVHVAPATPVVAAGMVNLMDGTSAYASATLSSSGDASFSSAGLSLGSHTLTAVYAGNSNLLPSASAAEIVTVGPTLAADFALVATGQTYASIVPGSAATFSFAVNAVNGALSSPIQLTTSGLPNGATASFNPAYLPPSNGPAAFILTIQTPKTAGLRPLFPGKPLLYAGLLPLLFVAARRRRFRSLLALAVLSFVVVGCGDRVAGSAATSATSRTYNITVIGTASSTAGGTLQHTAGVTLTIQ